jgi:hypothetical protein
MNPVLLSWISSLMTDAGTNMSLRQRFLVHVQVLDGRMLVESQFGVNSLGVKAPRFDSLQFLHGHIKR